jgi:hypothetical protein
MFSKVHILIILLPKVGLSPAFAMLLREGWSGMFEPEMECATGGE